MFFSVITGPSKGPVDLLFCPVLLGKNIKIGYVFVYVCLKGFAAPATFCFFACFWFSQKTSCFTEVVWGLESLKISW